MRIKPIINYFLFFFIFFIKFAHAQNPEFALREFASGQIKKGVRSIGMGGDGATWGNYALVWKEANTALIDAGSSQYTNDNKFSFTAVGVTLPPLKHGITIYAIALSQYAANISTSLKFPGVNNVSTAVHGDGNNQSVFVKAAMPLGKKFSFGVLLSYERSQFDAVADKNPTNYVRYQTNWLPSGGLGLTYQANPRILVGFRALFNNDNEKRIDNTVISTGINRTQEYRAGISVGLWKGALIDLGGNIRKRSNQITNTSNSITQPNIGFEQNLWHKHFAFRFGLDETSKTAGISLRFKPIIIDIAYVNNLAIERLGNIFGTNSQSVISTLVFDFGNYKIGKK